ncbi:MAG: hypothetical protein WDA00_04160 [Eubacteriales bacterium]
MKRVCSIGLVLVLLCTSCFPKRGNSYEYPEDFTPAYCVENYEHVDPNLSYLQSHPRVRGKIRLSSSTFYFAALKDVALNDFILLIDHIGSFMRTTRYISVVRRKGNQTDPIQDWTVKKVELFWKNRRLNHLGMDNDVWERALHYGIDDFYESLQVIDNETMRDEIVSYARTESFREADYQGKHYLPSEIVAYNDRFLAVRIYFEESENIVWNALIWKNEDVYGVERDFYQLSADIGEIKAPGSELYFFSDELNDLIDSLLSGYES